MVNSIWSPNLTVTKLLLVVNSILADLYICHICLWTWPTIKTKSRKLPLITYLAQNSDVEFLHLRLIWKVGDTRTHTKPLVADRSIKIIFHQNLLFFVSLGRFIKKDFAHCLKCLYHSIMNSSIVATHLRYLLNTH